MINNKDEFRKKCEDMLALEAYMDTLQSYRVQPKVKFRELVKRDWISLLMVIVGILAIQGLRFARGWMQDIDTDMILLYGVLYYGTYVVSFLCYVWLLIAFLPGLGDEAREGMLIFLWRALRLAFINRSREKENRKNATERKLAQDAKTILEKELLEYSFADEEVDEDGRRGRDSQYVFDISPLKEKTKKLISNMYGVSRWDYPIIGENLALDVFSTCCGRIKTKEEDKELRLDGFAYAYELTREKLREILSDDYLLLYADMDGLRAAEGEKIYIKKIYEIAARRLTEKTTRTTTTSYDVDKALKTFNSNLDALLNADAIGINEHTAWKQKGEKRINEALATTTTSESTKRCVGEELMILEEGYAVFLGNTLKAVGIPRKKAEELHIVYELDKPFKVEFMDYEMKIPEEERFHGKIIWAETRQVRPNPFSTALQVTEMIKDIKPFDASAEIPDDTADEAEMKVWRFFMTERFKKEIGRVWDRKECEELAGKPQEEPLPRSYDRKAAVNGVLLALLVWSAASITDKLPPMLRLGPVERAWKMVTEDDQRFIRQGKNPEFTKGCYQRFIHNGTNANIEASDARRSAAAEGSWLWVNDWTGLRRHNSKVPEEWNAMGDNYFCEEHAAAMLYAGDLGFAVSAQEDGESYAVLFNREKDEKDKGETVARGWIDGFLEDGSFTYDSVISRLYSILQKQESKNISAEEMAGLLYFTSRGVLLDYQDGEAIFADDFTDAGTVHVYRYTEEEAEELVSYPDDYAGSGSGRFIVEDTLYYAENLAVTSFSLEQKEGGWRKIYDAEQPIRGLNYAYGKEGRLCILSLSEESVVILLPSEERLETVEITGPAESIYTVKNKIMIYRPSEGEYNSAKGGKYSYVELN